jgi:amino acid adenylation domain-containing protein
MAHEMTPLPPLGPRDIEKAVAVRFDSVAHAQPHVEAIVTPDDVLTYETLAQRADAVAAALVAHGLGSGSVVAVLDGRTAGSIAGLLGCLRAGVICVPQDASHPIAHLATVLDNAGAVAVVVDSATRHLAVAARNCLIIDIDRLSLASVSPVDGQPDAPALICYTSGSTGRPKGIVHSNANLVHRALVQSERLAFGPADRHSMLTSIATGAGVSSVMRVLLSGGTLLACPPLTLGIDRVSHWLRDQRVTVFRATPTLFRSLTSLPSIAPLLSAPRIVLLGGERVTPADLAAARAWFGADCLFVNTYSATETSNATLFVADKGWMPAADELPVGHAVDGIRVTVVDQNGEEVPPGVSGQIVVASRYVALGYWRDPEQTGVAFEDIGNGERAYRTGDQGVLDHEGNLWFRGRADGRVKVRGQRIELEAIERALSSHPAVRTACVTTLTAADGSMRLVAAVVPSAGEAPTAAALRAFLADRLPPATIPGEYVWRDALPLTMSGKVDRRALANDVEAAAESPPIPPSGTATELQIVAIWTEILGRPPASLDEDFLVAGGDSLAVAKVLARVAARWGIRMSFATFFDRATVSDLARAIDIALNPPTAPT